ncbi:hypothetical protein MPTK1_5g09210 [Marchantia polymorpha subsp. ruderalis]|uniref:Uncharacterized protein n=2 Tax=Marchantia polymorpha TaxID=3197 RepID=A0AAF6BGI4_MARPO|nr:hypothetical protein MARPO_0095s0038 [Marchantia polymorpha]BBN11118.1 hypothetical protein Mp_5g09210 [Marchantia polymorpha subsp. ruderalis]|eukprot:PTQ32779.1 hypothetical protein MARPO_0095s0038 [Marchantia polymorpha]
MRGEDRRGGAGGGGGDEYREQTRKEVRVMGMFSCFQSPRAKRKCPSFSPSWADRIRRCFTPESPSSPIVREHNHQPPFLSDLASQQEIERRLDPSPRRASAVPRKLSPPRQLARRADPSPPPGPVVDDRNPSPSPQRAQVRNPSPPHRPVAQARNRSPPLQPARHRKPSPRRRAPKLRVRHSSNSRQVSKPKLKDYSPPRPVSKARFRDYSPRRQPASADSRGSSPPRQPSRAVPSDSPPPRASIIEPLDFTPPRRAAKHKHPSRSPALESRKPSPAQNAAPQQIPGPAKVTERRRDTPHPIVLPKYSPRSPPEPRSNANDVSSKPVSPRARRNQSRERQMERKGNQDHITNIWIDHHDTDHVHEWESVEPSPRGQRLARELQREAAHDRAVQSRGQSVTESCADSYCTRAENPLRQKVHESKFPFGTPEVRPISPPGWTYSPKRKTSTGEWWDKDWPKNKRYIFHDPNLQPCGCHWSKRHAGSRTPSPPTSARARGMAYADSVVKINRDRSLSPQRRSPRMVPARDEPPPTQRPRHRHEHLNWSCDTSRASSRPASRPKSPRQAYSSGRSTPFASRSPRPRSPPQASPSSPGGYCVSFSRSASPVSKPKPAAQSYSSSRPGSARPVRSRASAPARQRPQQQHTHIYVSSSSGCSTPTSICVQSPSESSSGGKARSVNSMGHCHSYGAWNCSPYEDPPPPKTRTPTPPRTPDYTVTITCPQNEESIDTESATDEVSQDSYHCHCSVSLGCRDDCHRAPSVLIAGNCDWHHVAHHHHCYHHHHQRAGHCCCACSHHDW